MSRECKLYVFTDSISNGEHTLIGKLTNADGVGTFEYSPDYLKSPDAFPIDPINLPLRTGAVATTMNDGVFNALLDSGPDKWGRNLMNRIMERPPRNNVELLLASSGGAGALHYSDSRTPDSVKDVLKQMYIEPDVLIGYMDDIEANADSLPDFIKAVLFAGISLGGARPKILYRDKYGVEHIAKLNKEGDSFNVSRVELSMLEFCRENSIRTPIASVVNFSGREALLIERFDRLNGRSLHYISAHSLLNGHRVRVGDEAKHISYAGLAEVIRKISASPQEDCLELFTRAAINILVGNTDDHLKNHGFVLMPEGYRLSPAFDIVPQPNQTSLQAIGVGLSRASKLDDLLVNASAFYLTKSQAADVIQGVMRQAEKLPMIFAKHHVSESDAALILKIVAEKKQTARFVFSVTGQQNSVNLKP